jgi:DNA-directed RNA polymerases I, II, and III subunit RPABC1
LDNTRYIIIFKERINNLNMRNLKEHMPGVEIFSLSEMMFNVSRHAYVPKHEIVSDPEEVAAVMTNYNIKQKAQFPVILRTDAMSKYLDIKIGDLVRITRPSVSAGESIVYRICA